MSLHPDNYGIETALIKCAGAETMTVVKEQHVEDELECTRADRTRPLMQQRNEFAPAPCLASA